MLMRKKKSVLKSAEIERICRDYFCVNLKINKILLNNAPTGNKSYSTVFQDDKNDIFTLCKSDSVLTFADVKNIIKQMGMKPEEYFSPNADEDYFNNYAKMSFQAVFPGRKFLLEQDTNFYKSFAPYSPALVKIAKVEGEIRHFDLDWNKWISAADFSYYRVKVK